MSYRSCRLLILVCLLGLLAFAPVASVFGQTLEDVTRYSKRLPTVGGPTAGMAGAGLFSGIDDPVTLYGNPAGLGWLTGSALGGDFSVLRTRSSAQYSTEDAVTSGERTVSDYSLGSLAGAFSFPTERGSLVLGMSLHQTSSFARGFDVTAANRSNSITGTFLPSSYGVDEEGPFFDDSGSRLAWESGAIDFSRSAYEEGAYPFFAAANPQVPAVDGEMELEQQENVLESGQLKEVASGIALEMAKNVMIGAGLNIVFGSYTFERFYRERDASDLLPPEDLSNPQRPYDPYFLEGTTLEGFYEYQLEERLKTDVSGVNLRAGLSARMTPWLKGGLLIETPTWYNLTDVYGTQMQTDFDCDFSRSGSACPLGGVEGFESGDLTGNEFEYRIRTPWRIGGGLQFESSNLTVAGDIEFVDWTQAQVSADDASFADLNRRIQGLEATYNTRLGAAYDFGSTTVRGGVAYQPDPRNESFQNIDGESTDADRVFLSAGISYAPTDQYGLHLNWMQERFDDTFSSYVDGPLVRESVVQHQFLVGITYRP